MARLRSNFNKESGICVPITSGKDHTYLGKTANGNGQIDGINREFIGIRGKLQASDIRF